MVLGRGSVKGKMKDKQSSVEDEGLKLTYCQMLEKKKNKRGSQSGEY